MTQPPDLRSSTFAPVAAIGAGVAGVVIVLIAIRLVDHGVAFGRWLAERGM